MISFDAIHAEITCNLSYDVSLTISRTNMASGLLRLDFINTTNQEYDY